MTLIALQCPACATALSVGDERQVFPCPSCRSSFTLAPDGDRLVDVPRRLIRPMRALDPRAQFVVLPLWSVSVDTTRFDGVGHALPSSVRVPAVGVGRMALLLQFARNLTRAPLTEVEWREASVRPEGAEVGVDDAFVLAETVVLRHLEHWPSDEQLPGLEIPLGSARLLDWPCALLGGELHDLVGGLSVHHSLVETGGLSDQRAALGPALEAISTGDDRR